MSRFSFFRRIIKKVGTRPQLESLEKREVLSGPTAQEAYMLSLINMARTNPPAAAQWVQSHITPDIQATLSYYNVDLNGVENIISNAAPRPALTWNDSLATAASQQSAVQIAMGVQTHTGANGSSIGSRLSAIGFPTNGENTYAYAESVDHAMEAFLIDWGVSDAGHRRNILQPGVTPDQYFTQIGIDITPTSGGPLGPDVVTIDFGRPANATTPTPAPSQPSQAPINVSVAPVSAAQTVAPQTSVAPQSPVAPQTTIAGVVVPQAPTYNPAGWSNWGSTWTANHS